MLRALSHMECCKVSQQQRAVDPKVPEIPSFDVRPPTGRCMWLSLMPMQEMAQILRSKMPPDAAGICHGDFKVSCDQPAALTVLQP